MSTGYTGLILNMHAELRWFNRVTVYVLETFETAESIKSYWHSHHTKKFNTKFAAMRYLLKVNKDNESRN
jgi:hypothetical protein